MYYTIVFVISSRIDLGAYYSRALDIQSDIRSQPICDVPISCTSSIIVDIAIARQTRRSRRNYLSISADKTAYDSKNCRPANRCKQTDFIERKLALLYVRSNLFIRATRVCSARCSGRRYWQEGEERDVSLWDNPSLLGAYYGVSSPNMAALLFNVRLMGSSWYRISLVATYRVVLYGLV